MCSAEDEEGIIGRRRCKGGNISAENAIKTARKRDRNQTVSLGKIPQKKNSTAGEVAASKHSSKALRREQFSKSEMRSAKGL